MSETFTARTDQYAARRQAQMVTAARAATSLRQANMLTNEQQREAAIRQHFQEFALSPRTCPVVRG